MLWANFDLNVAQWFVRRSGKSKKFVEGCWTTKFAWAFSSDEPQKDTGTCTRNYKISLFFLIHRKAQVWGLVVFLILTQPFYIRIRHSHQANYMERLVRWSWWKNAWKQTRQYLLPIMVFNKCNQFWLCYFAWLVLKLIVYKDY